MQGIGGEQHAPSSVISVGTAGISRGHLLVGQDEGGVAGKRAEHMSRCPVVQVIEAAAQRLAIERDGALPSHLPFNACAWRRKAPSRSSRSSARNRLRSVFTAGARRRPAPKAAFRRWTAMKVMICW